MLTLLIRLFIKHPNSVQDAQVRSAYGTLCSVVGIFLNLVLFVFKYFAGVVACSVSIQADAFNNLSDAGSSIITLFGFRLAGKQPDAEHPYGHGRFEYISGLLVSVAILIMGYQLFRNSLDVILHGGETAFADHFVLSVVILLCSVLVKFYMFFYHRSIGKKINSPAMLATSFDSISDMCSTLLVLVCALITRFFDLPDAVPLDAYCGILVSLFIVYAGFRSAKETIAPLLGTPPDREFVKAIENEVMSFDGVLGMHDLIVHDYGPGRRFLSLHAEVSADADVLAMHDMIDNIEKHLARTFQCGAVIHMDPIASDDPTVSALHETVRSILSDIDPALSMHDFRIVQGPTHTNLVFDVVVPFRFHTSNAELQRMIADRVKAVSEQYFVVIEFDREYA